MSQARSRGATAHRRRTRTSGAERIRRSGGLRRLPDLLRRLLEPAARRRGLAEAKLLTEWPTVVGPRLASRCHPIRMTMSSEGPGAVLVLHVAGATALELQHSEPQIVERINGYFGYGAVGRLRLIQAPLPRTEPKPSPAARNVSDAVEIEISEAVHGIRDPDLRAALQELGRTLHSGPGAIESAAAR